MKITQIVETTTSGSVATVSTPLFKQSRKGDNLLTGTKTKKKYANSISEGKMKELSMDLSRGRDGISDEEFLKKYGKTKAEMKSLLGLGPKKPQPAQKNAEKMDEAKLDEEDLILVPGQGHRLKSGFISHDKDRTDHEVEMARSDLFQSAKNAKKVYELIANISEEVGLEGWVQEKIIKANDYLNTIREYLEHKVMTKEGMKGAMVGGIAGAAITKTPMGAIRGAEIGNELEDMFKEAITGAGVIAGGPQYEGMAHATRSTVSQMYKMGWNDGVEDESNEEYINDPEYKRGFQDGLNHAIGPKGYGRSNPKRYKLDQGVAEGSEEQVYTVVALDKSYLRDPTTTKLNEPKKLNIKANSIEDVVNRLNPNDWHIISINGVKVEAGNRLKQGVAEGKINEKAVSQAQQKFMGMVHATQKGAKPASKEVAKVAKEMPKKAAKDFAQTKHKGLPQHVGKKGNE